MGSGELASGPHLTAQWLMDRQKYNYAVGELKESTDKAG